MYEANERLVTWVVTRLMRYWAIPDATPDWAMDAGMYGLAVAATLFDAERGYKFSTFAVPVIRHEVAKARRSRMRDMVGHTVSLDAEVSNTDELHLLDMLPDHAAQAALEDVDTLSSLGETVTLLPVLMDRSFAEIGRSVGYTRQAMHQRFRVEGRAYLWLTQHPRRQMV